MSVQQAVATNLRPPHAAFFRPLHGGGHAGHPVMSLPHPGLPPANTPTLPGAEVDPPTDNPLTRTAEATPLHHQVPHITPPTGPAPARRRGTRKGARKHPMPEPAPSPSLATGLSIQRLPPPCRTPGRPLLPSPPPLTRQPAPPQSPHPLLQPHPRPAPPKPPGKPPQRAPKPAPAASASPNAKAHAPAPARPKPKTPPSREPNPSPHNGLSLRLNPRPNPSLAPRRQRELNPPRTSYTTSGPSHPRPGSSNAQHGAPSALPTLLPPPSWRSAPQGRCDAPCLATTQSPHPRLTDHP